MRVNTGSGWQDQGPGQGRLTGITAFRYGFLAIALSDPISPTGMPQASATGRCVVCGDKTIPGRYACGPAHQKVAYGDRR